MRLMHFRRSGLHALVLATIGGLAACAPGPDASPEDGGGQGGTSASGGGSGAGGPGGASVNGGSGGAPATAGNGGSATGGASATGGSGGSAGGASTAGAGGASATGGSAGAGGAASTAGAGGAAGRGGAAAGGAGVSGAGGAAGRGGAGAGGAGVSGAGGGVAGRGGAGVAGAAGGSTAGAGGAGGTGGRPTTCNTAGAATATTPTIYVIGDSTASVYASDLYPRMGWAQPLQDYFAPACARVQDKALSGRSSKSFYDEGAWTPIRTALRAGDTVLIQFGHNDEKTDEPERGTDPFTTFEMYLSIYIDDTIAKGATPILITPINRNNWTGTMIRDSHGNYPVAMRQLAPTKHIALVDATALTKTYFERIGQTATTTTLFLNLTAGQFPNYPDGNSDNTHLQEKGARAIAQLILADMYRQALPAAYLLKAVPQAP
jgi:lysophospholipase L1-like esterase